ncbi:conserved MORN repeat-containing protein [Insectomime virus]|uniref:MORN repeat containing protein n=1 Tax=Tunisvirus fontaine2 TaxID=1421067 RepID=V9SDN5_9VIRU|nr:MORN repeat containing protein [Tunisvirus fontaine2]AHA45933.1 conserved MORN repeat-containing protein [Insectomime virus]AHC55008.1 MORN repeat containing protein [Tunisvirus fontaine2]
MSSTKIVRTNDGSFRIIKTKKIYDFSGKVTLKKRVERYNERAERHGNTDLFFGGVINSSTPYANGKIHGKQRVWFHNGKLASVTDYVNGKEHGIHTAFNTDGSLFCKLKYQNGELFVGEESWEGVPDKPRDKQR